VEFVSLSIGHFYPELNASSRTSRPRALTPFWRIRRDKAQAFVLTFRAWECLSGDHISHWTEHTPTFTRVSYADPNDIEAEVVTSLAKSIGHAYPSGIFVRELNGASPLSCLSVYRIRRPRDR
jgi:hypothetical protein